LGPHFQTGVFKHFRAAADTQGLFSRVRFLRKLMSREIAHNAIVG
jgi:hypothetical protein